MNTDAWLMLAGFVAHSALFAWVLWVTRERGTK
jgi:hypothetical protein